MEELQTKLFEAATQNSIASLHQLLKRDPLLLDRALVNSFNETPLHVAAMLGHLEFVQEIIRLKPELVNELNSQLSSPLHLAAAKGHVGVVKALLSVDNQACSVRDRNELLPLHLAAAKGHVEAMKVLLEAQPAAATKKAYGGESILHLCVKSYQLEALRIIVKKVRSDEFISSRDDDGNTVLHLAVAEKQVETIKFFVSDGGVAVNAPNQEGLTPLDVLIRSRRDVRDSQIEKSLRNGGAIAALEGDKPLPKKKAKSWDGLMKQHADWLDKKKNTLMIVAILIATMAFQVGVDPPGGGWSKVNEKFTSVEHPEEADYAPAPYPDWEPIVGVYYKKNSDYLQFYIANTTAFVASLSIILLLTSGLPLTRRVFLWILTVITWIAITSMAICYVLMINLLAPKNNEKLVLPAVWFTVSAWILLMAILFIGHTVRMILKLVKKLKKGVDREKEMASMSSS